MRAEVCGLDLDLGGIVVEEFGWNRGDVREIGLDCAIIGTSFEKRDASMAD